MQKHTEFLQKEPQNDQNEKKNQKSEKEETNQFQRESGNSNAKKPSHETNGSRLDGSFNKKRVRETSASLYFGSGTAAQRNKNHFIRNEHKEFQTIKTRLIGLETPKIPVPPLKLSPTKPKDPSLVTKLSISPFQSQ